MEENEAINKREFETSLKCCPHPHGHMLHDCVAYINLYIDNRVRWLYSRIKALIEKMGGEGGHGPWDYIILRDKSNPSNLYKVYIDNGSLRSAPYTGEDNNDQT